MRKILLIAFVVLSIFIMTLTVFAGQELCEADYQVSIKDSAGSTISFDVKTADIRAYSPLRVGNTGRGADDLVNINSQFNQPRNDGSGGALRCHKGVDFATYTSSGGRDVFLAYSGAKIILIQNTANSGGYGNMVVAQHKHTTVTGEAVYFQTLYAHLESIDLSLTNTYNTPYYTKVGKSGYTGLYSPSQTHLHLEFRTAIDVNSTVGNKGTFTYAPSVFYWTKGDWGNETSFINATEKTGNTVKFNIVSLDNGTEFDVPVNKVKIYHKKTTDSAFSSSTMTKSGNTFSYTFNTNTYPIGTTIQYYIEAQESRWSDGTTYYSAYRPYHYRELSPPPQNKCFTHTMVSSQTISNIESEEFSTISVDEAVKIVKNADTPLEPIIGISNSQNDNRLSVIKNNANIQIGAQIKSITEKGIIVSVISLPPTVIADKENCDLLKVGDECIVKCSFKFEYDPLLENSYWIIGIYDPVSNTITVEDSSLFWCSKLYPHNN